jgi:MoaA/NifB/PqqE/SkfB family radical SAM enzyme
VLPVPREIVYELTRRCNLACRCCFSGREGREPSLKKLETALRGAAALGVKDIRFTGGEPFLSPHLLPLLRTAKKLGCYTLVNTNACAPAALYAKAAPFMDNVLVSLQGSDQASDAAATGTGGLFRLKLANMLRLRGTVPVFRLGTVASRNLIKDFKAYHALAARLKADVWEIYRPMLADGSAAGPEFALGPADLAGLSAKIAALKPGGPRVLLANPLPLCLVPEAERKNLLGAAFDDGHTRLVYDLRGFFKPSYYIAENLGRGIKEAWRSAYMKDLRSFYRRPGGCRDCRYLLKCLGGSRALSKARGGSWFGDDPWLPAKNKTKKARA